MLTHPATAMAPTCDESVILAQQRAYRVHANLSKAIVKLPTEAMLTTFTDHVLTNTRGV